MKVAFYYLAATGALVLWVALLFFVIEHKTGRLTLEQIDLENRVKAIEYYNDNFLDEEWRKRRVEDESTYPW